MRRARKSHVDDIGDTEDLSQRISRGPHAPPVVNKPRLQDLDGVSMVRGRHTPLELRCLIVKGNPPSDLSNEGARYTTAGALRNRGFEVHHSPTNRIPDHVSVAYRGDWNDDVALLFEQCFHDHKWGEEVQHDE